MSIISSASNYLSQLLSTRPTAVIFGNSSAGAATNTIPAAPVDRGPSYTLSLSASARAALGNTPSDTGSDSKSEHTDSQADQLGVLKPRHHHHHGEGTSTAQVTDTSTAQTDSSDSLAEALSTSPSA